MLDIGSIEEFEIKWLLPNRVDNKCTSADCANETFAVIRVKRPQVEPSQLTLLEMLLRRHAVAGIGEHRIFRMSFLLVNRRAALVFAISSL